MTKHVIIYTDGSANPNPGFNGWGAHGYSFDQEEETKKTASPAKHLITNKGYLSKTEAPKIDHEIVKPIEYYDWCGSNTEMDSNNVAEMNAFIKAVTKLLEGDITDLLVYTDSAYLLNGVEKWIHGWKKNNWIKKDGGEVANKEHWILIDKLLSEISKKNINFNIKKIKAHANLLGNERADRLAYIGYVLSKRGEQVELYNTKSPEKYWNPSVSKHPFLCFKQLFFNTSPEYNEPGKYVIIDYKQDEDPGRKAFSSSYAIIELKEPNPLIELVREKQYSISDGHSIISAIKLDKLFSPEVYKMLNNLGEVALIPKKGNENGLVSTDGNFVCVEKDPPGLTIRAVENASTLDAVLKDFKQYKETEKSIVNNIFTDITKQLYTITDKGKKKLLPEINSTYKSFKVKVKMDDVTINVPILLGKDILPRNQLKKIETLNPVVYLCTRLISPECIGYCTIIETDDGLGVWSNFYSSSIFINS